MVREVPLITYFAFVRDALSICAVAAWLSACGGSSMPESAMGAGNAAEQAHQNRQRFHYTGKEQSFIVPSGVTALDVVADGAQGGGNTYGHYSEPPGLGGEVSAVIPVKPGEKLYVFVGGEGSYRSGGYNGGGRGGSSEYVNGFFGGGASDIRQGGNALRDRIVVAGGGGGAGGGYYVSGAGGAGGRLRGGQGCCKYASSYDGIGGSGGTQSKGGSGGNGGGIGAHAGQPGTDGARGNGGDGGASGARGPGYDGGEGGGGGGGGYYGGGGGGGGEAYGSCSCGGGYGGGGGGGSSYLEPNADKLSNKQGVRDHNGLVIIIW